MSTATARAGENVAAFPTPANPDTQNERWRWRHAIAYSELTLLQRAVAWAVELRSQRDDSHETSCFVSIARLAEDTGAGPRAVGRALAQLVEQGYLARVIGRRIVRNGKSYGASRCYTYRLVFNREAFLAARDTARVSNLAEMDARRQASAEKRQLLHERMVRLDCALASNTVDADTHRFETAQLQRELRSLDAYVAGNLPQRLRKPKRGVHAIETKHRERNIGQLARTMTALVEASAPPTTTTPARAARPVLLECGCGRHVADVVNADTGTRQRFDVDGAYQPTSPHVCS